MNCLKVFAAIFGPLAWLLQVIAIAGNSWLKLSNGWTLGLMKYCYSIFCVPLSPQYTSGAVSAAAGLLGFSLFLTGVSCIITWVSCCCQGRKAGVATASGVLYCISGFFNLVACILYAADMPGKIAGSSLGSSFIVAILGFLICIMSAIFIIIGGKKEANSPLPAQVVVMQQPVMMMQPGQQMMQPGQQMMQPGQQMMQPQQGQMMQQQPVYAQ